MDKRYQVFVSSTFADLKEERSKVIETIMKLDCIPSGMELFPAIDEEQFEFIKKVIDDCDYYILIIGGRYGSLSEDGASYTEKEYYYAKEKGLKVMSFIHANPGSISMDKSEQNETLRAKLDEFKTEVKKGRLVDFWDTSDQLVSKVGISLMQTIKAYPAIGWIRADSKNVKNIEEINTLKSEIRSLKQLLNKSNENSIPLINNIKQISSAPFIKDMVGLSPKINVSGTSFRDGESVQTWDKLVTYIDIFKIVTLLLSEQHQTDTNMYLLLSKSIFDGKSPGIIEMDIKDFIAIKTYLIDLEFIDTIKMPNANHQMDIFWLLTDKSKRLYSHLMSQ